MNKKESFDNSESANELQKQLDIILEQHHELNDEVDTLNLQIHSIFSQENDRLRHTKLRKLKLKDRIENLRAKLQLAE
jgi:hypothetical protein